MPSVKAKLTYANVAATLALLLAAFGVNPAEAAKSALIGSAQIKNHSVARIDLAPSIQKSLIKADAALPRNAQAASFSPSIQASLTHADRAFTTFAFGDESFAGYQGTEATSYCPVGMLSIGGNILGSAPMIGSSPAMTSDKARFGWTVRTSTLGVGVSGSILSAVCLGRG